MIPSTTTTLEIDEESSRRPIAASHDADSTVDDVAVLQDWNDVQTQVFWLFPELLVSSVTTPSNTSTPLSSVSNHHYHHYHPMSSLPLAHDDEAIMNQPATPRNNHLRHSVPSQPPPSRTTPTTMTPMMTNPRLSLPSSSSQTAAAAAASNHLLWWSGVLWKRRDVFVNQWRPRWFVLHAELGHLTYYLLLPSHHPPEAATTTTTTTMDPTTEYGDSMRPRGTIFLWDCTVYINDNVSSSSSSTGDAPYTFTIVTHDFVRIHLATPTPELRQSWVERIRRVGGPTSSFFGPPHPVVVAPHTTATARGHQQHNGHHTTPVPPTRAVTQSYAATVPPRGAASFVPATTTTTTSSRTTTIQPRRLPLTYHESDDSNGPVVNTTTTNRDPTHRPVSSNVALQNVPLSLQQQIQDNLSRYLPMCCGTDDTKTNPHLQEWRTISLPSSTMVSLHSAQQRIDDTRPSVRILRTTARLPHAPPTVFSLILDISQRHLYEENVAPNGNQRLSYINPNTFLDYYAYKPVWPTKAREFTVATHWQVMELPPPDQERDSTVVPDSKSIVILSFSCHEASRQRPPSQQFVRAHLFVSLYILQPVPVVGTNNTATHCQFTRLLSFDLAGNIPQQFSNAICHQQANLPAIISKYLHEHRSDFGPDTAEALSNEFLVSTVINPLRQSHIGENPNTSESSETGPSSNPCHEPPATVVSRARHTRILPSLPLQLITLWTPIFVHWAMSSVDMVGSGVISCFLVLVAVRTIVVWHIGDAIVDQKESTSIISHVTCRLRIDVKGILRYISNQHEERDEMKSKHTDISVIHIVASALANALKKEPLLLTRKVSIPWLLIQRVVDASNEPIDVSISENGGDVVTLSGVDRRNIQKIADCHKDSDHTSKVGKCLILTMSHYDEDGMTTDAAPMNKDVTVVAVLGGVHLERSGTMNSQTNPKPYLNLSLTISGTHQSVALVTCQRFADEVRKLLLYPEMCENASNGSPVKLKTA